MNTVVTASKNNILILAHVLRMAERRAAALLLSLALILGVLYVYFIMVAVVFAVEHKEVRHDIAIVNSRVASLEVEYLQKKSSIGKAQADGLGFVALVDKDFLERERYIGRAGN